MNFDDLNDDNFLLYSMKHYENPQCLSEKDFLNDLKIFKYIKRLLNKYKITGEIRERLMLNHIIMLSNIFPIDVFVRLLFLKMPKHFWSELKTFMIYLNYMPDVIPSINGTEIISSDIPIDMKIAEKLRDV